MNITQFVTVFLAGIGAGMLLMRASRPKHRARTAPAPDGIRADRSALDSILEDLDRLETGPTPGIEPAATADH